MAEEITNENPLLIMTPKWVKIFDELEADLKRLEKKYDKIQKHLLPRWCISLLTIGRWRKYG